MDDAILREINECIRRPTRAPFVGIAATFCALLLAWAPVLLQWQADLPISPLLITVILYGAAALVVIWGVLGALNRHARETRERTTFVEMELDERGHKNFEGVQKACLALAGTSRIWEITARRANPDWKRSAGVAALVKRRRISVGCEPLPYLSLNLEVLAIPARRSKLFFLPEEVLLFRRGRYERIGYDELQVSITPVNYLEDGPQPLDARVATYTWQFVRKDGGPDLRFSRNRRIPVLVYGLLELQAPNRLDLRLYISNLQAAEKFARLLGQVKQPAPTDAPVSEPQPAPETGYELELPQRDLRLCVSLAEG
jgi:hypothetical protein